MVIRAMINNIHMARVIDEVNRNHRQQAIMAEYIDKQWVNAAFV